jgi:integrase
MTNDQSDGEMCSGKPGTDPCCTGGSSPPRIDPTGTVRKRKIRMGARQQNGTIQTRGNWVYILYRVDTPEGRKQVTERLCPATGKDALTAAQQRRKAQEVLNMAGVNNTTKMMETTLGTTFRQQAEFFIKHAQMRKRAPVAASTVATWQSAIDKHLNPQIGDLPLSNVNNAIGKDVVATMGDKGLSAKSIQSYFMLLKQVIASAVNDEGEEIFPRKWNSEFIELPIVDATEQHRPTFSCQNIETMLTKTDDKTLRMLIVLAAASGMRLGEILGLNITNVSADGRTITVSDKAYRGEIQDYLKTANGKRIIDVTAKVGKMLREFIGTRAGLAFATRTGRPLSQSNLLKRHLHPLLEKIEVEDCGFHAFRRYRATWLRKQSTPEGLVQFWLGHSAKSITDGYDRVREDVAFRQKVASSVGTGFAISAFQPDVIVSKVREIGEEELQATSVSR